MLPLLVSSAWATTYNVTFCAEYDVVYSDADASFGDDYITTDGTYPARGARITVVRNSDSAVMRDAYAEDDGASAGCYTSTLALDSDSATPSTTHEANSKEYQSSAIWEGIAHYYSVVAFNRTDQANCTWVYYKNTDWNLDGDVLDAQENSPFAVSCQTSPTNAAFADYLGNQCSGTLTNRATEYDWLRFFWDLDYDQAVSTTSIYTIWDWANSDNWHASGNGWDNYSTSTPCSIWNGSAYLPPSWPSGRLRCAADSAGYLTEWDAEDAANGVHR